MAEALKLKKQEKELSPEETLRLVLKDVTEIALKLHDVCDGRIDELVAVCELARTSDAQARMIMSKLGEAS